LYSGPGITVLLGLPGPEDEGTAVHQNIRNCLPSNTTSVISKKTWILETLL